MPNARRTCDRCSLHAPGTRTCPPPSRTRRRPRGARASLPSRGSTTGFHATHAAGYRREGSKGNKEFPRIRWAILSVRWALLPICFSKSNLETGKSAQLTVKEVEEVTSSDQHFSSRKSDSCHSLAGRVGRIATPQLRRTSRSRQDLQKVIHHNGNFYNSKLQGRGSNTLPKHPIHPMAPEKWPNTEFSQESPRLPRIGTHLA